MIVIEIIKKIKYNVGADRIGPDLPFTHWKLYFRESMLKLCKKKFQYFSNTAEIRPGAYIVGCSKIRIGDRVIVRPNSMFFAETVIDLKTSIIIEDNVMMGAGVQIHVNNHRFDDSKIPLIDQGYYPDEPVILKHGCWIGANAIILPGVTIGINSVVGAGSIVTKSVPDGVVAVGNPARVIKEIAGHKKKDLNIIS
jgi:acetyltransferase-like isoleucine patch superfamily enzyme